MRIVFIFSVLFFLCKPAAAQFQGKVYQPFQDASVTEGINTLLSPWCGGMNSVQINHADINNDGKKDLVLYDHINNLIKTFINTGLSGDMKYTYNPLYEKNFPIISNYLILRDYNCDGIPDLFHKGMPGVSVYKGYYQSGELKFTFYKDLYFPGTFGPVNVYVQPSDIPSIQDIDGDGDVDVCSFDINGNRISFVKNTQVENSLPCDSMRMELVTDCYGNFYQSIYMSSVLGTTCKGMSPGKNKRHAGNCILLLDLDGDADLDFLGGNVSYNYAQSMTNGATSASANYVSQDSTWQSGSHVLYMPSWPAPFHVDIDNDGDKDVLFTSHNENSSSANYHSVAFYKNTGTDASPNFNFQHDSLLINDMIDIGSYSYPVFFDYDKDGKQDLFVGTEGYLNAAGTILESKIAHYKNTTVGSNISFELVTKDFLGLSTNLYNGIFPTFGDLTGDGITDLVFGNRNGYLSIYKNYATSNLVMPNFLFYTDSIPGITAGSHSFPLVYDFNKDGRTDLLLGNQLGRIIYYEDTSTTALKKLALQTISLGNFKAGDVGNVYGYCVPLVAKMDETNKEYLLIGNVDGTIARYDDFINNMGTFTRIDSNYSEIKVSARSVPAIADLDGNGKYEMVIGNRLGGLQFFRQVKNVIDDVSDVELNNHSLELYPNPTQSEFSIFYHEDIGQRKAQLRIVDITGNLVFEKQFTTQIDNQFSIKNLQSGIYLVEIRINGKRMVKKLVKQ
ncbi:MAG: T9SS type A sorting domain-containing protein [Bacteroidetes bacterium]|nr:T9SS type A sorting domain-containing protein [Bacteroidota bacterium]